MATSRAPEPSFREHVDIENRKDVHEYADRDEGVPDYARSQGVLADLKLAFFYVWSDIRKRPRNTCIGFAATLTVVLVAGLILLGISKSHVVFVRFAELSMGEMDALILAEGGVPFVNYTDLQPKLAANSPLTRGTAPRWLVKGEISRPVGSSSQDAPLTTSTNVLAVDTRREKEIGIGRAYHYRVIGFSEAQVLESLLEYVGVDANVGERARVYVDFKGTLEQQGVQVGGLGGQEVNETNATANRAFAREFAQQNPTLDIPGVGVVNTSAFLGADNYSRVDDTTNLINTAIEAQNALAGASITDFLAPEAKFTVADGFTGPLGKYPGSLGNMVILDHRPLLDMILEQSCYETLRNPLKTVTGSNFTTSSALPTTDEIKDSLRLEDYALVVVAMMADRFNTYYKGTKARDRDMIAWSNELFYAIGIDFGGDAQYPIASALVGFDQFALFLTSIFTVSTVVIMALGAILVYTLLLTNSEERGFEVAMLRAQGMPKRQLVVLMVSQMLTFVGPGLLAAIALIFILNAVIESALTLYTYAPAQTGRIAPEAVVVPILIGIVVPVLGNWGPIRAALTTSLRDALDVYRNKASETVVVAMRLAELGMDPFTVMVAWLLVVVGFMVYYLIPLAFIFGEMWLFFAVMNAILVMMLFGLCLVSGTLQVFLERGILWLLLWRSEKRLMPLIHKNFKSHSERNAKGYMMFTLSVACIVFGGVLFTLLASSITQTVSVLTGADVSVTSLMFKSPLNKTRLDDFLSQHPDKVVAWSYETFPLSEYPQFSSNTRLANSIGFPSSRQEFIGLDRNFLDATFGEFVIVEEMDESVDYPLSSTGVPNVVASLYDSPPDARISPVGPVFTGFPPNMTVPAVEAKYALIMPAISASAATDVVGLSAGAFGTIYMRYTIGNEKRALGVDSIYLTSTRALMNKFPGTLSVTPLPFSFGAAPTFISVPDFSSLLKSNEIDYPNRTNDPGYRYTDDEATTEVLYRRCYIRLNPSLEGKARRFFVNLVQSQVNPYYHLTVDTEAVVSSVNTAGDMIMIFFYFVSCIAIVLDTLMLWLTFVSNVQLNSWGFAVLRSLGFTVRQLQRAYIYESLSLVLSAFVVGTGIGIAIAITLVLQVNLFLQLPFNFSFPYGLFFFLMGLSVVSAIIAPVVPSRAISTRPIASVLKGG